MTEIKVEMGLSEENLKVLIGALGTSLSDSLYSLRIQDDLVDIGEILSQLLRDDDGDVGTKPVRLSIQEIENDLAKKINQFNELYNMFFSLIYGWIDNKEREELK